MLGLDRATRAVEAECGCKDDVIVRRLNVWLQGQSIRGGAPAMGRTAPFDPTRLKGNVGWEADRLFMSVDTPGPGKAYAWTTAAADVRQIHARPQRLTSCRAHL